MNLKKLREFFSLARTGNGGFTLVELIVVIAILAILAGVAIPAYSGYVAKADEAADDQLLSHVNLSFATACLNNYESNYDRKDNPSATINEETGELDYNGPFKDDFNSFYEGGTFKKITKLFYEGELGMFVKGKTAKNGIVVSEHAVNKLLNSTWLGAAGLSSSDILDMVDNTAAAAQSTYSEIFNTMSNSDEFKEAAEKALGLSAGGYGAYYNSLVDAKVAEMMAAQGKEDWEVYEDAVKAVKSSMAALVASQNAQSVDILNILTTNNGAGAKDQIKAELESDPTSGLSQSAMAYGMYHAWIHSRTDLTATQKEDKSLPGNALNNLNDSDFQAWLKTDQAQADLAALQAALGAVSGQNSETAKDIVSDGIASDDLKDALKELLGK